MKTCPSSTQGDQPQSAGARRGGHRLFERDPFIYFYEDFLAKYDAKMRKARGVDYTPPPIVNFIVRAMDDMLKESFGIPDGLADHKRVTVLDFACGTGTFLLEVFQRIFDNIGGPDAGPRRAHCARALVGTFSDLNT